MSEKPIRQHQWNGIPEIVYSGPGVFIAEIRSQRCTACDELAIYTSNDCPGAPVERQSGTELFGAITEPEGVRK